MLRVLYRVGLCVAAFIGSAGAAFSQLTWNVTYADGNIRSGGVGFADPTPLNGSTHGQLRRDSISAATQYLNTVLDGRGTVNLTFDGSLTSGSGFQAQFGPAQIFGTSAGSFQNGGAYQAARTNQHVFGTTDANGKFNFGYGWNYAGQTPSGTNYDMVTVAIHEITHGLGFLSFTRENGSGLAGRTFGTPDIYSVFDRYLQRGNGANGALFNSNIASSSFGAFTGPLSTLTNGNDPTTGLFFGGDYTREVLNGPSGLHAPNPYEDQSTASHLSDLNALMNNTIATNSIKRFQDYEIAMLMDIGWNVYSWNNTSGNWGDGATNVNQSRWLTNLGIVTNGSQEFNTFTNPAWAPILPVHGQVTSNIALNFGGSGSTGYTAINNLGNVRLARLNLSSTSFQANMISNGLLIFGRHSNGNNSFLTPKIVQQNTGAFAINSDIQIPIGLTVDGGGSGLVSLGGVTSGGGGLTKGGSFTLELNGSSANTFAGMTTVNAGVLLLNKTSGVNGIAGNLTINPGGTVRLGAPNQIPNAASIKLAGGILSTGQSTGFHETVGALELSASSIIALGSGDHSLTFTGIAGTPTGTLTITGWTGDLSASGTEGKLFFTGIGDTPNEAYAGFLSTVHFQNFGTGATFLATGMPAVYQFVPVPEPALVLSIAATGLGTVELLRRRRRQESTLHP